MERVKEFLEYPFINLDNFQLTAYHLLMFVLVIVITKIVLWSIRKIINRDTTANKIDKGRRFALYNIIKYVVVTIAVVFCFEAVGFDVTILVAGSAALLVGIGFGIQQIFGDFVAGLILLFEGTINLEDVVEVEGLVGRVTNIGVRTSEIVTRNNIVIILPNSKLTNEKVINWSHNKQATRFDIVIGVSYSEDPEKVRRIIMDVAAANPDVSTNRPSEVRLDQFAESSLEFHLLFWSSDNFRIERIKSDLRYAIFASFRKEGVTIPFPQMDVHLPDKGSSPKLQQ